MKVESHLITSASSIDGADEVASKGPWCRRQASGEFGIDATTDVTSESPDTRPTQMRRDIETPMFLLPQTTARDGRLMLTEGL